MRNVKYPHTQQELDMQDWIEITEERYYDLLGCLPPEVRYSWSFMVGEPMNDSTLGTVYTVCTKQNGKFWTKPDARNRFDHLVYQEQIAKQTSN